MKNLTHEMPGLDRVRQRFLQALEDRQARIAQHALAVRNARNAAEVVENLNLANSILHQIAGTAGVLGFAALGAAARRTEDTLSVHLESAETSDLRCPTGILELLDRFVAECRRTLAGPS